MRYPVGRSGMASICMLSLMAGLSACAGSGSSAPSPSASAGSVLEPSAGPTGPSAFGHFALGLVPTDSADIAKMVHIRHPLGVAALPSSVDLSPKMPAVGDQGQEGSCVAWATAYAMRGYEARLDVWSSIAPKTTAPANNFSAAFVYNQLNGGHDSGLTVPSALTLLEQQGAATLADMPYVAGKFTT